MAALMFQVPKKNNSVCVRCFRVNFFIILTFQKFLYNVVENSPFVAFSNITNYGGTSLNINTNLRLP